MRNDIHSPRHIMPENYQYVAVDYIAINSLGDALFLQEQRRVITNHRQKTGGQWASHEHGGTCYICGAHAIYLCIFYHAPSNEYIKAGFDCSDKLDMSYDREGANLFRKQVRLALGIAKGQEAARIKLEEKGLFPAWAIYEANVNLHLFEERIICELVGKLVRWGELSEKPNGQWDLLGKMLVKVNNRAEETARREAENALAEDCPNGKKLLIEGEVITIKSQPGFYGTEVKMLVKATQGFRVWGTLPRSLSEASRGSLVRFQANVMQSQDDRKFGFFNRPTRGEIIVAA